MATRRDIREGFYSHLEAASDGIVPPENIGEIQPNDSEGYPAITHADDWRKIPMNDGTNAPVGLERDENDDITGQIYQKVHEGSFGVSIKHTDESERETIYEMVRSYFEKYEDKPWDETEIHEDVEWVNVLNATSDDDTDSRPVVRGDRLIIRIGFTRNKVNKTDSIDAIGQDVKTDSIDAIGQDAKTDSIDEIGQDVSP